MTARIEAATSAAIARAVERLRAGELVGFPTETVYGLGADANNGVAVRRIFAAKGRPADHPLIVHLPDASHVPRWAREFPAGARALAEAFWPGPLTLVLPGGSGRLPDTLRGPEGGIAVRWTSHPHVARLVAALGEPLTSTSANRPGGPTAPGPDAIVRDFADAVDAGRLLVLDGGVLGNRPPSTVVDCTTATPRIVRDGALPIADLRRAVGLLAP